MRTRATDNLGAILVVDDNIWIRQMVKVFLEAAGYAVVLAANGEIGLSFFKEKKREIALLLTDVERPQMNGLDLADQVLEIDRKLPVIFMSGTAANADRGYGCVVKPFR